MIGRTISHYRILSQLAEGGMGVVYVAEDTRLGRRVAIKLPLSFDEDKQYHTRFLREARAVSSLSHPNIAAVYDYGETPEGQPYIVMELVDGQSLSELLNASALTIPRAVEITLDVAAALAEAHRRGIIHRDVKPSNIMLNARGEVKVLDFGLAKQLEGSNGLATGSNARTLLSTKTRSDVVIGTPLYLSPEQARGAPVDGRSDLFALGALFYECIAGRPAFSGANVIEIGGQVLHVNPPPPSDFNPRVSRELDRVTLKALAKKPEERYQSAEEMSADLRAALAEQSHSDTTRTRRLVPPTQGRSSMLLTISDSLRRPRISPVAFVGALALMLFGVWAYARYRTPTLRPPAPPVLAMYEQGMSSLRDGAYDQASKQLLQTIELDGQFALAHAALAEAWMELDYADKANSELVSVGTLVPDRSVLPRLDALRLEAVNHTALRHYPQAIQCYAAIAKENPDKPQSYVDLGRAYEKNEEPQKAIENYQQATKIDPQYVTPFLRLGILYGRQQQTASALAAFGKADKLYEEMNNSEGRAEVLYQRGLLYSLAKKGSEARQDLQQSLDIARANHNNYQQVQALLGLSIVYLNNHKQLDEAERYAREAVELARADSMFNLTARGLVDLGNVFVARGNYAEAETQFRQAQTLARQNKSKRAEAKAQIMLGSIFMQKFRTDEALTAAQAALGYYRDGGFRRETLAAYTLIGRAQRQRGDYDAALETFRQALKEARESNMRASVAATDNDIVRVLVLQERYPDALEPSQESYDLNRSLEAQSSLGYSLMNRSIVLERLGANAEARELLERAYSIANEYKALLSDLYTVQAQLELGERNFAKTRTLAEQALALSPEQSPEIAVDAQRLRGLALAFSGAAREGLRACEEALRIAEATHDPALRLKALLALSEVSLESGDAGAALKQALEARAEFARRGQAASEWHALLVAARAARLSGKIAESRDYAAAARDALASLEQKWGSQHYQNYLSKPEVQFSHRRLNELLAAAQ